MVYMDTNGYFYPAIKQIIPFNKVISDFGNNFNTTSFKFKCPVRGLYGFWFTLYTGTLKSASGQKKKTSAELMNDSVRLSEAYCYNDNTQQIQMMCANHAISVCEAGSYVWVQSVFGDSKIYGRHDRETTFSGFLIQAL